MTSTNELAFKLVGIFMALVALLGNALVCHVIVRLKTMKTSINYIILNLAVFDAIMAILAMPFTFINDSQAIFGETVLSKAYKHSASFAEVICKVQWVIWIPFNASPALLTMMAYERFKAITDPFSRLNGTVTKARLKWFLPLTWILGVGYTVCDMIAVRFDTETEVCTYFEISTWYINQVIVVFYVITQYMIPSIAMLILYGRVMYTLRKQGNEISRQAEAERTRRRARKNVMFVIITVTVFFYICCGIPHAFYLLMVFFGNSFINVSYIFDINVLLLTVNSAFNPFVYFIFMKTFRDGIKRVYMSNQRCTRSNNGLEMDIRPQHS